MLTNVSIYWFTGAGASSAHATYDGMQVYRQLAASWADGDGGGHEMPAGPPTGYAVFAGDDTIRSLVDPGGAVTHWSRYDRGGHFPAMEVPDVLAGDVRAFFRPLR